VRSVASAGYFFFCSACWDAAIDCESLASVVDFSVNEPDAVALWANSRFAIDQLSVREPALLAVSITSDLRFRRGFI
jgi:hypothetical protein